MTTPFPDVGSIRYSHRDRSWIAVWPLAPPFLRPCAPPVFAPEPADAEWVQLSDVDCVDMKLPPTLRLSSLVGDVGCETLADGVPLLVQENLLALRQPVRFSFAEQVERAKATVRRYEGLYHDGHVSLPIVLRRSLVRDTLESTARAGFTSLLAPRCSESSMCPCYFRDGPVQHQFPSLCDHCSIYSYRLEVCCEEAIPQLLPAVPRSLARLFFMDYVCPGGSSHGNFSTAAMAKEINNFDTHQAMRYNMSCGPECRGKQGNDIFRAVFAPLASLHPVPPTACAACPASVTETVCEYLGRQTVAMVMAPLFGYSCSSHPSELDMLSATRGPWGPLPTPDSRIRRIAQVSHYHHILTLFIVSHQARVSALQRLHAHVGEVVRETFASLVAPPEYLLSNHVVGHAARRRHWLRMFNVCHDPSGFLRAMYDELDAEGTIECRRAKWTLLWPLAERAIGIQSTPGAAGAFFVYVCLQTTELGRRWTRREVNANVVAGPIYLSLDLLYNPVPTSDVLCEPQCCPDGYTQEVANWVARASRRAWSQGRKRARRQLLVCDPWNRVFFGERPPVYDFAASDSEATQPYRVPSGDTTEDELDVERIEETDDDE